MILEKYRMRMIVKKVAKDLEYVKNSNTNDIFIIDKKKFRVKLQYNKITDKYFFTVHQLKKDGKHTTFKSWYYTKYEYNVDTGEYKKIRDGKYIWNSTNRK